MMSTDFDIRDRIALVTILGFIAVFFAGAQETAKHSAGGQRHTVFAVASIEWNPVGPLISAAVLFGSPETEGSSFVIRLKLADGAKIPPRWRPADEHITVISGAFHLGIGDRVDETAATAMTAGAVRDSLRYFPRPPAECVPCDPAD